MVVRLNGLTSNEQGQFSIVFEAFYSLMTNFRSTWYVLFMLELAVMRFILQILIQPSPCFALFLAHSLHLLVKFTSRVHHHSYHIHIPKKYITLIVSRKWIKRV